MAREAFSAELSGMIEQVRSLTSEQAEALGFAWTTAEGVSYDEAEPLSIHSIAHEVPALQNPELQLAWQRASSVASTEGRADELDAAIAAGSAAEKAVRHFSLEPITKAGAVEAARAAVLAVGVRDILDTAHFDLLVGPWQKAIGAV